MRQGHKHCQKKNIVHPLVFNAKMFGNISGKVKRKIKYPQNGQLFECNRIMKAKTDQADRSCQSNYKYGVYQ